VGTNNGWSGVAVTDLSEQIAIVTGASGGLGSRFAEVLGRHGASVALAARNLDRMNALEASLRADGVNAPPFPSMQRLPTLLRRWSRRYGQSSARRPFWSTMPV